MARLPYGGERAGGTPNHFLCLNTERAMSNGARVSLESVDCGLALLALVLLLEVEERPGARAA